MERFGNWLALKQIDGGGQGHVYKAWRVPVEFTRNWDQEFKEAAHGVIGKYKTHFQMFLEAYDFLRTTDVGALKVIHEQARERNPQGYGERVRLEVEILTQIQHPSLIRLLDPGDVAESSEKKWFVMEYHSRGPISRQLNEFCNSVQKVLQAIRPVIKAVQQLHAHPFIHRDIKTDNIFLSQDGRLVLGDCGIAFAGDAPRVTNSTETVGSSHWMPPYASGGRLSDVPRQFDLFCIGEVIWVMLTGKKEPFPQHLYKMRGYDLEELFPDNPEMKYVNWLLSKCIVDEPHKGVQSAVELLEVVDEVLSQLEPSSARNHSIAAVLSPDPIELATTSAARLRSSDMASRRQQCSNTSHIFSQAIEKVYNSYKDKINPYQISFHGGMPKNILPPSNCNPVDNLAYTIHLKHELHPFRRGFAYHMCIEDDNYAIYRCTMQSADRQFAIENGWTRIYSYKDSPDGAIVAQDAKQLISDRIIALENDIMKQNVPA